MRYKGKDMTLREYYEARMSEANVPTDCKTEFEYNILAEYESSCGIWSIPEIDFIEGLGYTVEDFCPDRVYKVTIESPGGVKHIWPETTDRKEAVIMYDQMNNGNGEYEDENGFVWDLYIDE